MSAERFAKELETAADEVSLRSRADLQILLRRAALRLRNTDAIPFDPDIEKALAELAAEFKTPKNEIVRRIVREGLQAMGYLPIHDLDEDSETEGNA
jgi:hypothetical protein